MTKELIKKLLSEILFGNTICESLIQYNDINFLYEELMLEKLLIGEPLTLDELKKLLNNKVLNFEFIKKDGEVRPAKGTTMMKYIPKDDQPSGFNPSSPKVAAFFDLTKNAWRSVSNKSREIVLDKDEESGKPKIVISDKKPKEEPKPGEMVKGKEGKIMKQPVAQAKPIVKPSIVPEVKPVTPKPEDITIPGEEETPLDILDPTIVGDEVTDKDIIVKGEKQIPLYPKEEPEEESDDIEDDEEEEDVSIPDDEEEEEHELFDIEDEKDDIGPVRIN